MKLAISDIQIDSTMQIRQGLDMAVVQRYMDTFEQLPPITVYKVAGSYILIDGWHRLTAAKRLEMQDIECGEVPEKSADEAREATALANCTHGRPWNRKERRDAIAVMLRLHTERADNWIAADVGCAKETVNAVREKLIAGCEIRILDKLLGRDGKWYPYKHETKAEEDDKVEPNTIKAFDCLVGMGKLAADSVELIFADPPYNLRKDYGYIGADSKPGEDYLKWCDDWFKAVQRILKPGGSFYLMHYPETTAKWMPMLDKLFTFRHWITWHYPIMTGHSPTNWTRTQRTILFYTKGDGYHFDGLADPQPYRNPEDKRVAARNQPGTTPYDVWQINIVKNVSKEKVATPNQLPERLLKRIILVSSKEGDLVCDPFLGSGTTAVVAKQLGRQYIGFDVNADYIKIAKERIAKVARTT